MNLQRMDLVHRQSLELSLSYQETLCKKWNKIVQHPLAFVPHEKFGLISPEEAFIENSKLGNFASQQMKRILRRSFSQGRLMKEREVKKIIAVGFGRSYDCEWLIEATLAGYETWWIDVSDTACTLANISMQTEWEKIPEPKIVCPPIVKKGEIRSILANPSSIGLDLSSVSIWYFCRTLTCLSERSAKIVMEGIGKSLSEEWNPVGSNKIEIISAMRDYNESRIGKSSKIYSIKTILSHITKGAGCPIKVDAKQHHNYFDQIYTALTFQAK